ncbi:LCP family glycopolymer transferase [Luteococcus sp. Sow4_B9]|uniref:LCP family protein n=1 Tax=Luteococcus sp. Sow4_B9 TaxID=3438792 RepID=UPI003F96ED50
MSSPTRDSTPARPRRTGRIALAIILALALVLAAAAFGYKRHLERNLTSVELPGGVGGEALEGLPKGVAQNLVIIGTDQRQTEENCRIGGSCGDDKMDGDTNADVLMVVHLSADHQDLSVVSIPRDTVIDLPDCTDLTATPTPGTPHPETTNPASTSSETTDPAKPAERGRINGTLNVGVQCTLRAVHELTGLPITHFMMVDFAGVISLSDAVGGVDVCVDADVYDTYSHLKLKQGEHTLQGEAALQFLRTRHGFGDGSDLGRTGAQHLYLSSLQRELESLGTLLNPAKVHRLAEASTRALTVDAGLDTVTHLAQLAATVGQVSTESTAFVTLPTETNPDNPNTVVAAPEAEELFAKLLADQPLASASPTPSPDASSMSAAAEPATSVTAEEPATEEPTPADPTVESGAPSEPMAVDTPMVSAEARQCAQVSTQRTVEINGVPMTPTEAYAASPNVPDSAS